MTDTKSVTSYTGSNGSMEPLHQVKLLSALRSGDPALIHPFLTEIGKDKRSSIGGNIDTGAAALHLAVRCGSVETVTLLLSHRAISPNGVHPPGSGTTALHLAASLGRVDIVNILLEQENIDDTLLDSQGRSCKEVARGKDVVNAINDSRAFLNASYRSLLRSYILSPIMDPPSPGLLHLLEIPRVKFVDLSYLDDGSGSSLLHEAAKRKDLRLIELAVRAGADVFVRNRQGKMAYEGSGKDERVRVFLRQFANHDRSLLNPTGPVSEPPAMKGYLNKYTNVAKGYNTRWFVLKGGVLSYYRHQADETIASRGSISMKTAILKVSERLRFEIQSMPSRGHHSGAQKWYLKANHPVEASRWTQAISQSIAWHRNHDTDARRKSAESESNPVKPSTSTHSHSMSVNFRHSGRYTPEQDIGQSSGNSLHVHSEVEGDASPNLIENGDKLPSRTHTVEQGVDDADDTSADSESKSPPHEGIFDLHGNTAAAQLELTSQLLSNLTLPPDTPHKTAELKTALQDSFTTIQGLLTEYVQMARDRDEWWRKQLRKERGRQSFWEESLATVIREGETLEQELRARSRRRGSRTFGPSIATGGRDNFHIAKRRPSAFSPPLLAVSVSEEPTSPTSALSEAPPSLKSTPHVMSSPVKVNIPSVDKSQSQPARIAIMETISSPPKEVAVEKDKDLDDDFDTDEEDEFFDAIETNNLPNLVVPDSLSHTQSDLILPKHINTEAYLGYMNLRKTLDLSDDRPSVSLWSVLKHSIGKDLTKISFPVSFNEPTSMLQRMAEDMEFSECLDVASQEKDSLRRIAFVAAFAMSNYSSTIGRIAKPFNPMLSETFEYVRHDKKYRYMSEQVSHHPPISACWAESPSWHYFGEVDAQNKFMGKSFEIRPTGVAHVELLLPTELAPGYPKAPGKAGLVVEHYSWKKVTSNISGFILGSPTIDHYGDMIITNHRTNEECILTFKPRGWRGRDAFEISGQVADSAGRVAYMIAGRWNSQLIAKQAGIGEEQLHPDTHVSSPQSPTSQPEYILLWRNSEKIPGSPFNLTPFAITLNDCPKTTLKPFLCPTDCRLRPDQRAFELGKYDLANDLKVQQEEKQRAIRKAREDGRLPPHKPRWFRAETDGDTGERVWTPSKVGEGTLEYWAERERVWKLGGNSKASWKNVGNIFIDEPDIIRDS